jgi:hypothetical protein
MSTARATPYKVDQVGSDISLLRGARNGVVAGAAMAMVMMGLGIIDQGLFAAPSSIWALWAGPAAYHPRDLDPSFFLGAMGHMMNSAAIGILFAFIATRVLHLGSVVASVMAGVAVALAVLAAMWFLILPLGANGYLIKAAAAGWVWIAGHVAFGMVGGFLSWRWR